MSLLSKAVSRRSACTALLLGAVACSAQSSMPSPKNSTVPTVPTIGPAPSATAPVTITLEEAIRRAEVNEPTFASVLADRGVAVADRNIARSALLPNVLYHNQAVYTQPNDPKLPAPQETQIFIANNSVHEYVSQAQINETVGLKQFSDLRVANANAARATAELEIARRGLVATVVNLFFTVDAAQAKLDVARRAAGEADDFTGLTQKRETAREVARADVIKAQLEQQQRRRELSDAQVAAGKSRMELAVLLFPDPRTAFVTQSPAPPVLGSLDQIETQAAANSAEYKSALASLHAAQASLTSARAGYLPEVGLNFTYGIDAPQFAKNAPDGTRNLGYSVGATVDIPVWDWLATQQRIKQGQLRRDAARTALNAAQRRLIAALEENYAEAEAARDQLASLDESVTTATESLRLTRLRYTSGEATVLEVVDAQGALLGAENAREDGMVRYRVALANLQTLTGTL